MSEDPKTKNDIGWESLFTKYDILNQIAAKGSFVIGAKQIKEVREPRLMAKADNSESLPKIFKKNNLSILPISRSEYFISPVATYEKIPPIKGQVIQAELPDYVKSLDLQDIRNESMAINLAYASGILRNFLDESDLLPTVSGRMSSGLFSFNINSKTGKESHEVTVVNSQIEIDAAIEGINSLTLIEAKRYTAPDFLIRQLYYPYRAWEQKIAKKVRSVFFVYSNEIFHLYEYAFTNPNCYNSINLVKAQKYSVGDTRITLEEIEKIANKIDFVFEPEIPFPQADNFERVIDLCVNLNDLERGLERIGIDYGFDIRQARYYSTAGMYLGLISKNDEKKPSLYTLTITGKKIFRQGYKERQLSLCKLILEHKIFFDVFKSTLKNNMLPNLAEVVKIMKDNHIYNVHKDHTFKRRAQTVISWVGWIFGLTEA